MEKGSTVLFLFVILASTVSAQYTGGNLDGWVLDSSGTPVVGANVRVTSTSIQVARGVSTDDRGYFRMLSLPVGQYTIVLSHISFRDVSIKDVQISLGRTTSVGKIRPALQALEMSEVVVSAERPSIDPTSAAVGFNMVSERTELLPIDRGYQSIPQLLPHANVSFYGDPVNVAGGTGLENAYLVNGADVSDPFRGVAGTNLPYNFIRELQVKTGAYEAEYRGSLGGLVNVVTSSGGNEAHGQAFGFFTNNQFAASPRYAFGQPPQGAFTQYDVGVTLGGPLVQDELWYFLAYNPKHSSEVVPVPGQPDQKDSRWTHLVATKLLWSANDQNQFSLSLVGDPETRRGVGVWLNGDIPPVLKLESLDPWLVDVKTGGVSATLSGIHFVGNNAMLESSISMTTRTDSYQPATVAGDAFAFLDDATKTMSGGYGFRSYEFTRQIGASLKGSFGLGAHTLKTGLAYLDVSLDSDYRQRRIEKVDDTTYFKQDYSILGPVRHRDPSLFVQDSWQVSDRLCINGGLRWDPQFMLDSDGNLAQKITNQWQPRIGMVYLLGALGEERITASFGRFFEDMQLSMSELHHNRGTIWNYSQYSHDPRVDPTGGQLVFSWRPFLTKVPSLSGQYFDEFTLGYERQIGWGLKAMIRGIYRTLRDGIEDGYDPSTGQDVYGNPGKGPMQAWPRMKRDYTALEITLERTSVDGLYFLTSYVLSRNYGNYSGLAQTDFVFLTFPNNTNQFDIPEILTNGTGLLPNDRTHVFKTIGSYRFDFGLTTGVCFVWASGTPLNEFGLSSFSPRLVDFIRTRGTVGRTPSIWDLNLRLSYDFLRTLPGGVRPRLIVDVLHFASQRTPVQYDQVHYFTQDANGNWTSPNSTYGEPIQFQPPMSVRLGMEVNF